MKNNPPALKNLGGWGGVYGGELRSARADFLKFCSKIKYI